MQCSSEPALEDAACFGDLVTVENIAPTGEVVLFETADGQTCVEVRLDQETVWLSLNQMAELFERDKDLFSGICATYLTPASWSGRQLLEQAEVLSQEWAVA
jgi:hypothetical protein